MFYCVIVLEIEFCKAMDLVYHKIQAHRSEGYVSSRAIQ